jgi:hypothetical protein
VIRRWTHVSSGSSPRRPTGPIAVVFTDGTVWNFEVDKMNVGKAKRLGAEFAGANEV